MIYRTLLSGLFLSFTLAVTVSCADGDFLFDADSYDFIDADLDLNRSDYENMAKPRHDAPEALLSNQTRRTQKAKSRIPTASPILSAPKPPRIGKAKLVSITVTDDVPLKDVFIELSRLADVDIELGSGLNQGINFRANNKPFSDVVSRISALAGLRYSVKNGVLRVEQDTPYIKNYSLDFLNLNRSGDGSINVATNVLSGGEGGGSGSVSTGSSTSITATAESDFWSALETNIAMILAYQPAALGGGTGAATAAVTATGDQFVINRQAGVLSAAASDLQHQALISYLERLRRNSSAQVLIEAKIVEVELNDQFQSGIDWTAAFGKVAVGGSFTALDGDGGALDANNVTNIQILDANPFGINLDTVVDLTSTFGTTRTLSSPRLHATNNQQAVLTFAENRVFFDITVEEEDATVVEGVLIPGDRTTNVESFTVPVGILMSIIPSINLDRGEVTLNIRPTLSRQIGQESVVLSDQQIIRPVIEVRELDSVMKLKSGQMLVIGGLMEDNNVNVDAGLPGLSEIPFIGNAFKKTNKNTQKTELIIFIKATIMGTDHGVHSADETIYNKFTDDPRPLAF